MKFILFFILLSLVNVTFSTVRTITTVKSGKLIASLISGGYFAYYNIVLIYTVADFPLWQKCLITFCCNVIGVYTVKYFEEIRDSKKVYKVECTIKSENKTDISKLKVLLENKDIGYYFLDIGKYTLFSIYASDKSNYNYVLKLVNRFDGKYFISKNIG